MQNNTETLISNIRLYGVCVALSCSGDRTNKTNFQDQCNYLLKKIEEQIRTSFVCRSEEPLEKFSVKL